MITLSILVGVLYALPIYTAYLATRKWHSTNHISPSFFDVVVIFVPLANIYVTLYLINDMHHMRNVSDISEGFAKKFFRL